MTDMYFPQLHCIHKGIFLHLHVLGLSFTSGTFGCVDSSAITHTPKHSTHHDHATQRHLHIVQRSTMEISHWLFDFYPFDNGVFIITKEVKVIFSIYVCMYVYIYIYIYIHIHIHTLGLFN